MQFHAIISTTWKSQPVWIPIGNIKIAKEVKISQPTSEKTMMQIDAIESGNNDKIPLICYCRIFFMIQQPSHQNPTLQAAIYDIQQQKIKIKRIQHKESIYRENWLLLQLHARQNYKKHIKTQGKTIQPEMSGRGGERDLPDLGKLEGAQQELSARTKCGSSTAITSAVGKQNWIVQ